MKLNLEHFKETVKKEEVIYLATSSDDEVTIRPVSPLVMEDVNVYFYTSSQSGKFSQMKKNPRVAFCVGMNGCYQAEGEAEFLGSVDNEENTTIKKAYKERYKDAFEVAAPGEDLASSEFIRIQIKVLKGWIFDENNPELPIGLGEERFTE